MVRTTTSFAYRQQYRNQWFWLPVVIMAMQVFFALGIALVIGIAIVGAYKAFFGKD